AGRLWQRMERAGDGGDHAGGNAGVAGRGLKLVMAQKRLDDPDIGTAFEQVGGKTVAQRVQAHPFLDSGPISRFIEQPAELAGSYRLLGLAARKQPAFLQWHARVPTRWANLSPLPPNSEPLGRQHDVAILAALRLLDANDVLRPVDVLDLQPHHFAGAQPTAITEAEQHANLKATGDGQQATCLVRAHHLRDLLRLAQMIDLG